MLFATAAQWFARLADAHHAGAAADRTAAPGPLTVRNHRRSRLHPVEAEAADLFFQLVSARYERVSLIVTSNKPFGRWAGSSATKLWPTR